MHICYITSEYPKEGFPHGGIGTFVKTIAQSLVKRGVRVSVVGYNYTDQDEYTDDNGVNVYRLKRYNGIKGLQWYFRYKDFSDKIAAINEKDRIDIVEGAESGFSFLRKLDTVKYIIRLHGGHHFFAESENRSVNKWKGFLEKQSFKKADAFIAVSEFVKTHTANYLSYHAKPIEKICYPIQFDKFSPQQNVQVEQNKIVFAGTVCEKKGIRQLIQALAIVNATYPSVHLDVYGRDWFFPNGDSYIAYLKSYFTEGELNNVTFKGVVSNTDLPRIYQSAGLCAFPSHMETQGLVAPEAMAMEKCVLFSQLGPGPETIVSYETGLLCNPLDPNDIAEKIIWSITHPEKCLEIGKAARQAAISKFELEMIITQNLTFYKRILG